VSNQDRTKQLPGRPLTNREIEVFGLFAKGLTKDQIAEILNIEYLTVKSHVSKIRVKLGLRGQPGLHGNRDLIEAYKSSGLNG
jgi:DNA-binding NarL/FixJ family response regulator